MEQHEDLATLVECLAHLRQKGFTHNFSVNDDGMVCLETEEYFTPENISISDFFRFEGESDPSDESILYAIETKSGIKGTLVNSYGVYAGKRVSDFIQKVKEIHKETQATSEKYPNAPH